MSHTFASSLDALADWRGSLLRRVEDVARFIGEHDLGDASLDAQLDSLRERLAQQRLVVAFVAEFSRGKSELINAIFFADAGRRILPATPGRTTMCPVELAWDAEEPPALQLLPIDTRLAGQSLGDLRQQPRAWTSIPLDVGNAEKLASTLREVTKTSWVSQEQARALGFWNDDTPEENPPLDEEGRVEVPAWRHALINYPHPLLKQGLVVLDTPGLNAIGAEPELTLSLLPSAHATVFILGADTGVTKSDLAIWRDHLSGDALSRFVVLNKIDALIDPLASPEQVRGQIESQCSQTARTLGVPAERVFPLSARQALAARVAKDPAGLTESRLPALEEALGTELMPQRRALLERAAVEAAQQIESQVSRRLADGRRQLAEQLLELRGLRGKSGAKTDLMLRRVDAETAEFEACTTKLQAMRSVHTRMLKDTLVGLSSDRLREEVGRMQTDMAASLLNLGAKKAFVAMCKRLHELLGTATRQSVEIREMLSASFSKLNAEFGFGLVLQPGPDLARFGDELSLIEKSYVQYLGLGQALKLSQPKFMEQFRRMLMAKLRVLFENASAELEMWNKGASAQVDAQLRERRRSFRRRREALERIQAAAGELETRLAELETQDDRLQGFITRLGELADGLRRQARSGTRGEATTMIALDLPLTDDAEPSLLHRAQA